MKLKAVSSFGFIATDHAINQMIRRWATDKTYLQAEEELLALLNTSTQAGKTPLGDMIVVSGHRPEVRMVVKDRYTCVTVLPPADDASFAFAEEMEMMREAFTAKETSVKNEIANMEAQVVELDIQRKKLGERKHELSNRIDQLKRSIKWKAV